MDRKTVAGKAEAKTKRVAGSIRLDYEVAAAVLSAATSSVGYATTTGSEHATRVREGVVRVELPHATEGRRTVIVNVPTGFTFGTLEA